ncbi:MAG: hypothetical protein N0E44_21325 [Candidatus Thiodiazotropha lotti]|nr:hypothetical protein [Candidatus Thiodiazotropha lotti]MCW4222416.1 hypothetical protein [Candidatus Thiodiazotropha lotti]
MMMQILDVLLYAYYAGTLVVALRLIWHMAHKLDKYDWHYNRSHIFLSFIFYVLLWPILLAKKPGYMMDPSELFTRQILGVEIDIPGRMRMLDQLRINPPPCGPVIRYCQGSGRYAETCGEFLFSAEAVEAKLVKRLQENPVRANNEVGAVLNWVRQRDDTLTEPTNVPDAWWQFQSTADDLVRQGDAVVRCLKCGKEVQTNELVRNDDSGLPGWNFNRLACPEGHNLLVVEVMHLLLRNKG